MAAVRAISAVHVCAIPDLLTGNPSEIFLKCLEEVQAISCATLFSPVARQEAVQAMGKLYVLC